MRAIDELYVSEGEAFQNWMDRLSDDDKQAWNQDAREMGRLIGLEFGMASPEDPRLPAIEELLKCLWTLVQMGYPLPVLQSLREGRQGTESQSKTQGLKGRGDVNL